MWSEAFISFDEWLDIALQRKHPTHLFSDDHRDAEPEWEREFGCSKAGVLWSAGVYFSIPTLALCDAQRFQRRSTARTIDLCRPSVASRIYQLPR